MKNERDANMELAQQIRIPLHNAAMNPKGLTGATVGPDDMKLDPNDMVLIGRIVQRGAEMALRVGAVVNQQIASIDIALCHKLHCRLNLWHFLMSSDDSFSNDFFGILRFWERNALVLTGGFKPQCIQSAS